MDEREEGDGEMEMEMEKKEPVLIADVSRVEKFAETFHMMGRRVSQPGFKATNEHLKILVDEIYHRRVKRFPRSPVIQRGIDDTWEVG